MPVRIPTTLPARIVLERENIFVMGHERAEHQDIRPLRVAILNLMPTKIETETQLLRLLGYSALQVEITLLQTATYQPKNTSADHLIAHYHTWEQVRKEKFDGLVITGAPVENLPFKEVEYWDELCAIMDWAAPMSSHAVHLLGCPSGALSSLPHPEIPSTRQDVRGFRTPGACPQRKAPARLRRYFSGATLAAYRNPRRRCGEGR
jgi:homoserine O-succinyltransferase